MVYWVCALPIAAVLAMAPPPQTLQGLRVASAVLLLVEGGVTCLLVTRWMVDSKIATQTLAPSWAIVVDARAQPASHCVVGEEQGRRASLRLQHRAVWHQPDRTE